MITSLEPTSSIIIANNNDNLINLLKIKLDPIRDWFVEASLNEK